MIFKSSNTGYIASHCTYHLLFQISMGGMRYDEIRQCGVRSRELGPMISVSIPPYASYEEMVMKAKEQFFANDLQLSDDPHEYFLADAQGSKLMNNIGGKPWNLTEYLHAHGIYPSKTKIYCVQVNDHRHQEFIIKEGTPSFIINSFRHVITFYV